MQSTNKRTLLEILVTLSGDGFSIIAPRSKCRSKTSDVTLGDLVRLDTVKSELRRLGSFPGRRFSVDTSSGGQ